MIISLLCMSGMQRILLIGVRFQKSFTLCGSALLRILGSALGSGLGSGAGRRLVGGTLGRLLSRALGSSKLRRVLILQLRQRSAVVVRLGCVLLNGSSTLLLGSCRRRLGRLQRCSLRRLARRGVGSGALRSLSRGGGVAARLLCSSQRSCQLSLSLGAQSGGVGARRAHKRGGGRRSGARSGCGLGSSSSRRRRSRSSRSGRAGSRRSLGSSRSGCSSRRCLAGSSRSRSSRSLLFRHLRRRRRSRSRWRSLLSSRRVVWVAEADACVLHDRLQVVVHGSLCVAALQGQHLGQRITE